MAPEGMVHALEIIYDLLEPGGCLIDIHPNGQPPSIEAGIAGQLHLLGYLQETDDFSEYGQASAALAEVTRRGLFTLERQGTFIFIIRAASLDELHNFLNESWSDSIFPDQVERQAGELIQSVGEISAALLTEQVLVARLRKSAGYNPKS
jgi:hypothetical protein